MTDGVFVLVAFAAGGLVGGAVEMARTKRQKRDGRGRFSGEPKPRPWAEQELERIAYVLDERGVGEHISPTARVIQLADRARDQVVEIARLEIEKARLSQAYAEELTRHANEHAALSEKLAALEEELEPIIVKGASFDLLDLTLAAYRDLREVAAVVMPVALAAVDGGVRALFGAAVAPTISEDRTAA